MSFARNPRPTYAPPRDLPMVLVLIIWAAATLLAVFSLPAPDPDYLGTVRAICGTDMECASTCMTRGCDGGPEPAGR